MKNRRKFSIFISSTYEDLKKERQALVGVALENNFIPVGMEQFHAAPTSQWNVITKMIDECDFYLETAQMMTQLVSVIRSKNTLLHKLTEYQYLY